MNTKKTRIEKQEMSWMNGDRSALTQTDVNRHKSTGTNSCNHLITQSPVLDLLHAHGDSPEERCSSRLVPFAIRTRFAVLLAGVKRVCNAAAFASPFRPLPARAPSVRKSAISLFP